MKASRPADTRLGRSSGSVTRSRVCTRLAPSPSAACSSARSKSRRPATITSTTNGSASTVCASDQPVPFADQLQLGEQAVQADRQDDGRHDQRREGDAIEQRAADEPAARQAEGERHAQRQGEHRRGGADIERAHRGIDPLRIVEIALVPLRAEAGRRELHVGRRAERDREHHEQRQHQEDVDRAHRRPRGRGGSSLRLLPGEELGHGCRRRASAPAARPRAPRRTASSASGGLPARSSRRPS